MATISITILPIIVLTIILYGYNKHINIYLLEIAFHIFEVQDHWMRG